MNDAKINSEEIFFSEAEFISDTNIKNEDLLTKLVALLRRGIFPWLDNCLSEDRSAALKGSVKPAFLSSIKFRFSAAARDRNLGDARIFSFVNDGLSVFCSSKLLVDAEGAGKSSSGFVSFSMLFSLGRFCSKEDTVSLIFYSVIIRNIVLKAERNE